MKKKSAGLGARVSPMTLVIFLLVVVGLIFSVMYVVRSQYMGTDASSGSDKGPRPTGDATISKPPITPPARFTINPSNTQTMPTRSASPFIQNKPTLPSR